jgi:hypothetical protein
MILHTVMPLELVLEGLEPAPARRTADASVRGVRVVLEETSPGRGRLVRLLSTDPYDYLNPFLIPGTELPFPQNANRS